MKLEKLFTIDEVSKYKFLGYKKTKIQEFVDKGELRSIIKEDEGKKKVFIPESSLKEFLSSKFKSNVNIQFKSKGEECTDGCERLEES